MDLRDTPIFGNLDALEAELLKLLFGSDKDDVTTPRHINDINTNDIQISRSH